MQNNYPSEPAERMLQGIRTLLRLFTVDEIRFPAAEGRMKYNALDFQTVYYLSEKPGSSSASLSRFLGVSRTTTQSVVDRLISRGLVRRDDGKGRTVALYLTEKGEDARAAIRRQDMRNIARMLSALPEKDQEQFASHIATIANALEEHSDGAN